MRKSIQIVALSFALFVCFAVGSFGAATAQPSAEIQLSATEVQPGDTFDVSLFLDTDGHKLVSGRVQYLTFDPTVVETTSAQVVPGGLLVTPTVAKNEVNTTEGTVRFDAGDIDWALQTPPGNFVTVTFTVKDTAAVGTYPLELTWMRFMDENATLWVTPSIAVTNATFNVSEAPEDTTPPVITGLQPADGACVNDATPTISASYSDPGSGIDVNSVVLWLDGGMVTPDSVSETGVSYTPADDLDEGAHTVTLNVSDTAATPNTNSMSWSFTVDTVAPTVAFIAPTPANNTEVAGDSVNVTVTVTEVGCGIDTVNLSWNGTVWTMFMTADTQFSFDMTGLENGTEHTYYVEARDIAGNVAQTEMRVVKIVGGLPKNGDMNGDGQITFDDVILLAKHFYFKDEVHADPDVNSDGSVTFDDVILLAKHFYFKDPIYP